MLIAVPSESADGLQAYRSGHFGHAAYFTLVTIEDGKITNVSSAKNADHDAVGCFGVIEHAISLGIDGILAAGMGQPPFMRFSEAGIDVYFDQTQPVVGDAIELLLKGEVQPMRLDQACVH